MFTSYALTALLALVSSRLVRADVMPSAPGPGDSFNVGSPCTIAWGGDSASTTAWKDMSIQLMTGSNLDMVHITTVATGQDGTKSGTFSYTCPDVTPNSAIYFYQFSSATAPDVTWTTRFTIASSTGATTDPTNATQPTTNDAIPWGTGALTDPSKAVPPPSYLSSINTSSAASSGSSTAASASSTTAASSSTGSSSSSSRIVKSTSVSSTSATGTSSAAPSATNTQSSGALSTGVDAWLWQSALSVAAFAVLL